jgi:DNA-binding winged helix-turn-helix (wHTH) protein
LTGDDGRAQASIRTVHGMGFSFVADVTTRAEFETDSALGPQYRLSGNKIKQISSRQV